MSEQIFISYRRDTGESLALLISYRLRELGYKVFLDVESMRSGLFNEQLYEHIDNCEDFLLVLTPGALDRCVNPEDWVRKEIARAICSKRNIIPIIARGFDFPEYLPDSINDVRYYQGVAASSDFFDATLDKLIKLLHSESDSPSVNTASKTSEFEALLESLYSALAGFREGMRDGDQQRVNQSGGDMQACTEKLFRFHERYRYSNEHQNDAALAGEIVDTYNEFIHALRKLFSFPGEERLGKEAQRFAAEADSWMHTLIEMITKRLG